MVRTLRRCGTRHVKAKSALGISKTQNYFVRQARQRPASSKTSASRSPPNNVLRRWVFPACDALGLKRATWLTFRRTYASWAHDKGVPGKVIAQIMGHAKVDTTLNIYTQVLDGSLKTAADRVGSELFTIVHKPDGAADVTH
jgi:integrase